MANKNLPLWCKKAKIAMDLKGIEKSELAMAIGNNRSYVSSVLNGRVFATPIRKKISDYLNITDADTLSDFDYESIIKDLE